MREKRTEKTSHNQARVVAAQARRRVMQPYPLTLAAFVLVMTLALPSEALNLREQKQIQSPASPLDLQITQVKALPVLNDRITTDVEIRWTIQVPRLTTIDEIGVLLEVRYSDGSKGAARSQQLKPSARAAILSLATHPRQNSTAILKDFKAAVKLGFRVASTLAVVQQIASSQGDSAPPSSGSSSGGQPEVLITTARLGTQGCLAGTQCVDVKWTASSPRTIAISEFTITVEARHKDATQTTDSRTVGGQDRQVRLQAGSANLEVSSMKVTVLVSFSLLDAKTAGKDGVF